MNRRLSISVLRSLLRVQRHLAAEGENLVFRRPLDHEWGTSAWLPLKQTQVQLGELLPFIQTDRDATAVTPDVYRELVLRHFSMPMASDAAGQGFLAVRTVSNQMFLQECSSSQITNGLEVSVTSGFKEEVRDENGQAAYVFSYKVRMRYFGDSTIQLESRHWLLKEGEGGWKEIMPKGSPGVVGAYPTFGPRKGKEESVFQYTSGCVAMQPPAQMKGSLRMVDQDSDSSFDAVIAPFQLTVPRGRKRDHSS